MYRAPSESASLEAFLLGQVEYGRALELQERLARVIGERDDGQIVLLVCEHPAVITVGRGGSASAVPQGAGVLRSREVRVQWVKRGGGCLAHTPGQLAVYPIVPLRWHGLSVGEYMRRLEAAVRRAIAEVGISCACERDCDRPGVWGRTGQLAAFGVSVRDWVTSHGAFINVSPPMGLYRLLATGLDDGMSSLVAERQGPVRMTSVRAALVRHLAEALGCERYHLYTGHPLLRAANRRAPRAGDELG